MYVKHMCTCYRPAFDVVHLGFRVHGTRSFQALANFFTSSVRLPPRGPARQPSVRVEPHKTLGAHGALRPFTVYTVRVDHAHCKRVCVEPVRSCASTTSLASLSVSSLFDHAHQPLLLQACLCRACLFCLFASVCVDHLCSRSVPSSSSFLVPHVLDHTSSVGASDHAFQPPPARMSIALFGPVVAAACCGILLASREFYFVHGEACQAASGGQPKALEETPPEESCWTF
jgi:hypothetical protein